MDKLQQLRWHWNQPVNQGKRIVVRFVIALPALAACIWAVARLIG